MAKNRGEPIIIEIKWEWSKLCRKWLCDSPCICCYECKEWNRAEKCTGQSKKKATYAESIFGT